MASFSRFDIFSLLFLVSTPKVPMLDYQKCVLTIAKHLPPPMAFLNICPFKTSSFITFNPFLDITISMVFYQSNPKSFSCFNSPYSIWAFFWQKNFSTFSSHCCIYLSLFLPSTQRTSIYYLFIPNSSTSSSSFLCSNVSIKIIFLKHQKLQ